MKKVIIEFHTEEAPEYPYIWDYEEPIVEVINKHKAISLTHWHSRKKEVIIVKNIRRIWEQN
ncbi:hypothetical protein P4V01_24630 [Bacillus thuringiensis]|uniref:Uncharacterized protein n=1 Tax=Bacillus thuringiensis TaxID=1428 RepID=A0AAW9JEC7_BACTU|nr:hypothetical protein [Bacillus thuringiensis]MDZ5480401.1 hypothetical protein [Bacillus thuringiensis]MED1640072.1 hypothetical protein [Bacillus thuringiensis]